VGGVNVPDFARYVWPPVIVTVLLRTTSNTSTGSSSATVSEPSQRSSMPHVVPRIVAELNFAVVRKLPFAFPHSCWTIFVFGLAALIFRGAVQLAKLLPTSVRFVSPAASDGALTVNVVGGPSTAARSRARRSLIWRDVVNGRLENMPVAPPIVVNTRIPFSST